MKVTTDIHEFYRKTGIILLRRRLRELGIFTDDVSGTFRANDVDDIVDFCSKNPAFHIVTHFDTAIYVNRYDARGTLFKLAEGDCDPNYMLDARPFIRSVLPIDDL